MKERREVGKKEEERSKKEGKREVVIKVLVSPIGYSPEKISPWHILAYIPEVKTVFVFFIKEKNFEFWRKFFCTSHILVVLELFPSEPPRILHHIIIICLHWLQLYNIYIQNLYMCVFSRFSCVWLVATLWTVICQAPLSMRFSRQEHWSGLPCPSPGDLPDPGIEPASLMSPALAGGFFTTSTTWDTPVF